MNMSMLLGSICGELTSPLRFIGIFITAFKIVVPLIIIVLGIFDLGRAAISSKPEEIKDKDKGLLWRLVGGVVIFFLPSIILAFMNLVSGYSDEVRNTDIQFETCRTCLLTPSQFQS